MARLPVSPTQPRICNRFLFPPPSIHLSINLFDSRIDPWRKVSPFSHHASLYPFPYQISPPPDFLYTKFNIAFIKDTLSLLRRNFEDSLPKSEKKVFVLKLSFHGTGQIDRSENGCRGRARKEGRKKDRKREGREAYVFDRRENRRRWWALTAH